MPNDFPTSPRTPPPHRHPVSPWSWQRIGFVYEKEMRETLRDKRVLFGVFISPLLITPLLLVVIGYFANRKAAEDKAEVLTIAIVDGPAALREAIARDASLSVITVQDTSQADALVQQRTARAAIIAPADSEQTLVANGTLALELVFDPSNEKSISAMRRIQDVIDEFNRTTTNERLKRLNLDAALITPTTLAKRSVASDKSVGGLILGALLPYLIVMTAAFGGMTSAFDLGAGEKERGTMETLLVSPATRTEIILGKTLTITTVSFASAVFTIIGLVGSFVIGLSYFAQLTQGKIAISYTAVAVMTLVTLPLTLFTSSLLMILSSFARNQKEAQSYSLPFVMVVILPAMLSLFVGDENPLGMSLIPLLNCALAIKQSLAGSLTVGFFSLTFLSSAIYAAIAVAVGTALFNREEILFRS
ncbi:MAG: ABC transporter permease [Chloracidobacterium sp.]|uniref:ABC transporter permease n=1 Tax=Chloracidobacterium validum TaxID=2821543 RepID=A0ABX8B8P8_9BACT|nr:ABC transporter permease [Chloracidobacterium validum]QUW03311.1 ABC transporter permease [Chloracidobacterium validum]